ncbi:MAG: hypothetical protein M1399_00130 [Actinobacteria bacterium]|nr:hypothetical protein [Actinomycetota bacterium]MCL5446461.1 hypothetical protein [Actinomycetota bacterium]
MRGKWHSDLGMTPYGRRGVLRYLKRRKRSVLVFALVAVLAGVVAGGLYEVSGKPGPYASSIDLSYASLMQPVARNSSSLGAQILDLIYHPQGLSRVAMMDRVESLVQATSTDAAEVSNLVPPYPSGGSARYCTRSLAARFRAASMFRTGVYGLLGGPTGSSPQSASSVLSDLADAAKLVAGSDALWRRCVTMLRDASGHARLQPSIWETVRVVTAGSTSAPTSSTPNRTTSTSSSTPNRTTSTTSSTPNRATTTTSSSSSSSTLSTSSSRVLTSTAKSIVPGAGSATTGVPLLSHGSRTSSLAAKRSSRVQVLSWSHAALNAFVAALAADSLLVPHQSVSITTYALSPSPLPSSTSGVLRIPPASSFSVQVVAGDSGNTYLRGVTVSGEIRCVSSGTGSATSSSSTRAGQPVIGGCGGTTRMVAGAGHPPGGVSLDPGGTVAFVFRPVKVKPAWTYSVLVTVHSTLPGVSSRWQFTLAVSPDN